MATGDYIDGHTKIFISDRGTRWEVPDRSRVAPTTQRVTGGMTKSASKPAAGFRALRESFQWHLTAC